MSNKLSTQVLEVNLAWANTKQAKSIPSPTEKLSRQLLTYSPEKIMTKPLLIWAAELSAMLENIEKQRGDKACLSFIANIYQQAVLILSYAANPKAARELCYAQIQLFLNWQQRFTDIEWSNYLFQPWMYLARLDSQQDLFQDANNKLASLNSQQMNLSLGEFLHDQGLSWHLKNKITYEWLQLHLKHHQYLPLIQAIQQFNLEASSSHNAMLYEALLIAFANVNDQEQALSVYHQGSLNISRKYQPIFELRAAELSLAHGQDARFRLYRLHTWSLKRLASGKNLKRDILFGLSLSKALQKSGCLQDAAKLAYFCLEAAQNLGNDIIKTDCLISLYYLIHEPEGRALIQDLLDQHYQATDYLSERQKMQTYCRMLSCESAQFDDRINFLYEKLLALPNIYF